MNQYVLFSGTALTPATTARVLRVAHVLRFRAAYSAHYIQPVCLPKLLLHGPQLARFASSIAKPPKSQNGVTPGNKPRTSIGVILRLIFKDMLTGLRQTKSMFAPRTIKALFKKHPINMTVVAILYAFFFFFMGYTVWFIIFYAYNRYFTKWPEDIAFSLRKALFYRNVRPNPKKCLEFYAQAIAQCKEHGFDMSSDDVLGIRISLAEYLEEVGDFNNSINLLVDMRENIIRILAQFDHEKAIGNIPDDGVVVINNIVKDTEGNTIDEYPLRPGDKGYPENIENLWAKRRRLLTKKIQITNKIAELLASPHVMEHERARQEQETAVTDTLSEIRRREKEGVREYEGEFLDRQQLGANFEALALLESAKGRHELAVPLYLQALPLSDEPCTSATIMSNLATSFASYPPYLPSDPIVQEVLTSQTDPKTGKKPEQKIALLTAARNWARNALSLSRDTLSSKSSSISPGENAKCLCCALTASVNLAEIYEKMDMPTQAEKTFRKILENEGPGGLKLVRDAQELDDVGRLMLKEARKRVYEGLERVKAAKEAKKGKGLGGQ